ncbi:MAG TPA: LacI family DNA-binding transcriptional regulator [Actinoplanes sp.]|nr:LacI family DNA-binding transcriptional regulator [Actinoplanes sp.]
MTEATSSDVARLAGVSRATVSHILNGRGQRFTAETHEKVRRAVEELRYRPSPAGRALVRGRSDLVLALIPYTTFGTNLQDAVDRMTAEAAGLGLQVVVRLTGPDLSGVRAALLDLRPAAVVDWDTLTGADRDTLRAAGIVVIDAASGDLNHEIGRLLAGAVLGRGPRTLVYAALADPRSDIFGPDRYAGMTAEAAARGLGAPARVVVPLDRAGASAALRPLLDGAEPLAIGCYNDDVAIAVLAAVRDHGRRVPDDVTVAGVDHTPIGQLVSPRLTTIHIESDHLTGSLTRLLAEALGTPVGPAAGPSAPTLRVIPGETS